MGGRIDRRPGAPVVHLQKDTRKEKGRKLMTDPNQPNTTSLMLVGILSMVFGVVAMAIPALAGKTVVIVIGILLVIAGISQVIFALKTGGWSHKLPPLILGAITTLVGFGVLGHQLLALTFLTLLLAISFVIEGIWKIFAAFNYRPSTGWFAVLVSGVLSLLLGLLIWMQWPVSGLWAVGVLVGVNLLMTGVALIAVAATLRQEENLTSDAVKS